MSWSRADLLFGNLDNDLSKNEICSLAKKKQKKTIQKENVQPSVCDLKLKWNWIMRQNNDLRYEPISEWLK